MMFGLSLLALCLGVALAAEAVRQPRTRGVFEALAGCLVVCSLCLLGIGLPLFR